MIEVINFWLENFTGCSWGGLAKAIRSLGGHDLLADKILKKEQPTSKSKESGKHIIIIVVPQHRHLYSCAPVSCRHAQWASKPSDMTVQLLTAVPQWSSYRSQQPPLNLTQTSGICTHPFQSTT